MTRPWTSIDVAYPSDPIAAVAAYAGDDELAWLDGAPPNDDTHAFGSAARYSLVCARPLAVLEQFEGRPATFEAFDGRPATLGGFDHDADGWRLWRRAAARLPRLPAWGDGPTPGWVGYVGYEMAGLLERLPQRHREALGLPLMRLALFDRGIVLDQHTRTARLLAAPQDAAGLPRDRVTRAADDAERWNAACAAMVGGVGQRFSLPANLSPTPRNEHQPTAGQRESSPYAHLPYAHLHDPRLPYPICLRSDVDRGTYESAVRRALDYIAAGDAYQANLSQRLLMDNFGDALAVHAALRHDNPAPYAALLRWGDGAVVSASPELFLRVRGRDVLTRPIKGTRPRGDDEVHNSAMRAQLLASPKDAAELAMIVDLHRNDLGRVCEYGSIRVARPRVLEAHPRVYHTLAEIAGRLRPDADALDLLRACFPAGSVTGAPKIRAMQIIDELEWAARGVYTGAIGVLGLDGSMTLNVAIRTLQMRGGRAALHVGGGIVADSDPGQEYDETLAKAAGILAALGMEAILGTEATLGAEAWGAQDVATPTVGDVMPSAARHLAADASRSADASPPTGAARFLAALGMTATGARHSGRGAHHA